MQVQTAANGNRWVQCRGVTADPVLLMDSPYHFRFTQSFGTPTLPILNSERKQLFIAPHQSEDNLFSALGWLKVVAQAYIDTSNGPNPQSSFLIPLRSMRKPQGQLSFVNEI
ncbi:hypothetical protein INT43_006810 [Umbelopsis isabellina]|uniref:Uncharacterized protein n=1 Tax=Mortierella isabellina TaxID=91625 RepID=A0A8H7Q2E9_MORIS|nr:hypothetical protein INT43_006810 [Umbelopsis isabellina]